MLCISDIRQTDHSSDIKLLTGCLKDYKLVNSNDQFEIIENKPFVHFSSSGGTERKFLQLPIMKLPLPIVLYSIPRDNSSAATAEISFYLKSKLVPHVHCKTLDELKEAISKWEQQHSLISRIQNLRILRVGDFSSWLINEEDSYVKKVGFPNIIELPIDVFMKQPYTDHPLAIAGSGTHNPEHIQPAQQLYSRLISAMESNNCTALTVKCFDLLTTYPHHAACYPYAKMEQDGILCACEGELSSLLGMVFLRECLPNHGIFMANYLENTGSLFKFAHCTAPLCGLGECGTTAPMRTRTHYETKSGLSVTVQMKLERVIVFKLRLGQNVYQLMTGEVVCSALDDIEEDQCRTQVQIKVDTCSAVIGNHYLICAGGCEEQLRHLLAMYGFFETK